jgi:hypothetical protein
MRARRGTALLLVAVVNAGILLVQSPGAFGAPTSATNASAASRVAAALHLSPSAHVRYDVIPDPGHHRPALASSQLPTWTHTVNSPAGNPFTFTMVGGDPYATGTTTTTVSVPIIGIHLVFAGGGETDATAVASDCGLTTSPVQSALSSPLFNSSVAGTQYVDAFQRANFGDATSASGSSPNYHLLLAGSQAPGLTVDVPATDGFAAPVGCGANPNALEGVVNQDWLDSQITSAMPTIAGVSPGVLPIFLLYDTLMLFPGGVAGGYHTMLPSNMQTYAVANYQETDLDFAPSTDVNALTHEAVEWANDPFGNNIVPTWGYIGQETGCDSSLEVADPLSNLPPHSVAIGSDTYHVPDAAFVPWFFRQSPSPASGGAYSLFGTFAQPSNASVCPAQPVSVKAAPGDGKLTVSWNEPSETATIKSFEVLLFHHQAGVDVTTWLTNSSSPLPVDASAAAPSNATSAAITGLTNGTAYDVVVVALSSSKAAEGGFCNPLFVALGQTSTDDCSTPSFALTATPAASAATTTSTTTASTQGSAPSSSPAQATLSSSPTSSAATSSGSSGSQLAVTGAAYTLLVLALGVLLTVIGAFGRGRSRARRLPR